MIFAPKAGLARLAQILLALLVVAVLLVGAGLSLSEMAKAAPRMSRTTIGSDVIFSVAPQTLTVTSTQTLTPTGSFYLLAPATVLTLTLSVTDARPGDILIIGGTVITDTVVLTNNTSMTAARTITDNDIIRFRMFNGQWVEESYLNNTTN